MKTQIFIILLLAICLGCSKSAEPLSIERMDYVLNNLKTQGYFINCDNDYCYPFYLFRNGVYLSCGAIETKDQQIIDSIVTDIQFVKRLKSVQYGWGVFLISSSDISIEEWLPGNEGPYPTELYKGEILNDSTILISGLRGTKYQNEMDTFNFRYLVVKPDSTNMFIN